MVPSLQSGQHDRRATGYAERFDRWQQVVGLIVLAFYATAYLTPWLPFMRFAAGGGSAYLVELAVFVLLFPLLGQAFRAFGSGPGRLGLWALGAVLAVILANGVWSALEPAIVQVLGVSPPGHDNTTNLADQLRSLPGWGKPVAVTAMVVLGPAFEELLYRCLLFRTLERFGALVAHLGTATLFGFQHVVVPIFVQHDPSAWVHGGAPFLFSLVLTGTYARTRTLAPGIVAHVLTNGLGVLVMLTS
jgi:membrane protease YdiL (CAAX protease family)